MRSLLETVANTAHDNTLLEYQIAFLGQQLDNPSRAVAVGEIEYNLCDGVASTAYYWNDIG